MYKKYKKIYFLNAIRTDIHSGGNTSSIELIKNIKKEINPKIKNISLQPFYEKNNFKFFYTFASFPAPFFVLLNRFSNLIFTEFLLRFSIFYFLKFFLMQLFIKPDMVVFNHHSSFIYAFLFLRSKKIFVWHDLPSNNYSRKSIFVKLILLKFERNFLNISDINLTFSNTDKKYINRFYKRECHLISCINNSIYKRQAEINQNCILLIANWKRPQNYEGAFEFFKLYSNLMNKNLNRDNGFDFVIAGNASESFIKKIKKIKNISKKVSFIENYKDLAEFNQIALLAPINDGAGIKLKTLEAWSFSIPVIGTKQAFSGLPKNLWSYGGHMLDSVEKLALFCLNRKLFQEVVHKLNPTKSFSMYQDIYNEFNEIKK